MKLNVGKKFKKDFLVLLLPEHLGQDIFYSFYKPNISFFLQKNKILTNLFSITMLGTKIKSFSSFSLLLETTHYSKLTDSQEN